MSEAHGAKTASAIKVMLYFLQPHLSGSSIDMYGDNEGAKALPETPGFSLHQAHRRMLSNTSTYAVIFCGDL